MISVREREEIKMRELKIKKQSELQALLLIMSCVISNINIIYYLKITTTTTTTTKSKWKCFVV
jgi:hypothetical protein